MKLRPFLVAVFGVALLAGLAACAPEPPPPPPASTVDQQVAPKPFEELGSGYFASGGCDELLFQTFTAGRTGTLDKVSWVLSDIQGDPILQLEIRTVDASGVPTSTVIGSGTYAGPFNGEMTFTDMPLSSPAAVTAGTQYASVFRNLTCDSGYLLWYDINAEYGGGLFYITTPFTFPEPVVFTGDAAFRTWVR